MLLQAYVGRIGTIPALTGKVVVGQPAQMEGISSSPYAWITDVLEIAGGSPITGPVRQEVELRLMVAVGAMDMDTLLTTRDAVKDALLNYTPDPEYAPMEFRNGKMEFADPGWWFWRDEFVTRYYMT